MKSTPKPKRTPPLTSVPYLQHQTDGVVLSIWAQPKASRTALVGEHEGHLKIQLAAPPADDKANEELISFLSRLFRIPKRQITIQSGLGSRRKRLLLEGIDRQEVLSVLAHL